MVTLLRVVTRDGTTGQCDARCHNAHTLACDCCCGGRYHGKQEGTPVFAMAVRDHQERILADLGLHEQAGELWIAGYRARLAGPLHRRPPGRMRACQDTLFAPED